MTVGAQNLAEALGVHRSMIYKYERAGKIRREPDGKFDLEKVRQQLAGCLHAGGHGGKRGTAIAVSVATGDPSAPRQSPGPAKGTIAYAQLQHETAKAAKAALEVQKLQWKLVDQDEVKRVWCAHITAARNRLLSIGHKLSPQLAMETDPLSCQSIVDAEVYEALHELSEWQPPQS